MSKKPEWDDALHLLQLFGDKGLDHDQLARIRGCGVIADVCEAAEYDLLSTYNGEDSDFMREETARTKTRRALGLHLLNPDITELPGIAIPQGVTIESLWQERGFHLSGSVADCLISQKFPMLAHGCRRLFAAHFGEKISTKRVKRLLPGLPAKKFSLDHFELASVEDLLTLGGYDDFRALKLEEPITCVGSPVSDDRPGRRHNRWYLCLGRRVDIDMVTLGMELDPGRQPCIGECKWSEEQRFLLLGC